MNVMRIQGHFTHVQNSIHANKSANGGKISQTPCDSRIFPAWTFVKEGREYKRAWTSRIEDSQHDDVNQEEDNTANATESFENVQEFPKPDIGQERQHHVEPHKQSRMPSLFNIIRVIENNEGGSEIGQNWLNSRDLKYPGRDG